MNGTSAAPDAPTSVTAEGLLDVLRSVVDPHVALDLDTPLLSSGLVDSFGVVVLLASLEDSFAIEVRPELIDATTVDTGRSLLRVLEGLPQ